MQISSRFTIAVHILTCIDYFHDTHELTSEFIASSVGVNPVIIRQIILQLKAAGLIEVIRGKKNIELLKRTDEITLYDVYEAVESVRGKLFRFHENPNPDCPVGKKIHDALDESLDEIQNALEESMKGITLKDIFQKAYPLQ